MRRHANPQQKDIDRNFNTQASLYLFIQKLWGISGLSP